MRNISSKEIKIVFVFYSLGLIYLMLFGFGRKADDFKQKQLIPFKTMGEFVFLQNGFNHFFINIICNIILFIPFGFFGTIFSRFRYLKWNLIFFWIALFIIEFLQYFTGKGTADVDDFILNSKGVVLGNYLLNSKFFQTHIHKNQLL